MKEFPNPSDRGVRENVDPSQSRAMFCHFSAYLGFIFPLGGVLGPLIVWLTYRNKFPFVDAHGKESLNFQISLLLYLMGIGLSLILVIISGVPAALLVPFALVLGVIFIIANFILPLIAALKAYRGMSYRYPLIIRFIK